MGHAVPAFRSRTTKPHASPSLSRPRNRSVTRGLLTSPSPATFSQIPQTAGLADCADGPRAGLTGNPSKINRNFEVPDPVLPRPDRSHGFMARRSESPSGHKASALASARGSARRVSVWHPPVTGTTQVRGLVWRGESHLFLGGDRWGYADPYASIRQERRTAASPPFQKTTSGSPCFFESTTGRQPAATDTSIGCTG